MVAPTHLKSLQALELAVRKGSLVAAAEELGITPAAAGQRVKALEDYLGITLLWRGRAGIEPAPELRDALPHLLAGFAEIAAAASALQLQRGQEIHIAAAPDIAELWLKPRLPAFQAEHPNMRFIVNGEGAQARFGKADCEIVFGPADLGGDLLFRDYVLPLCSPEIGARTARRDEAIRLEGFPLIHVDFYKDDPAQLGWPAWFVANSVTRTDPERGMRYRRISNALDAVAANVGVALCGIALLRAPIELGTIALPYPVSTGRRSTHAFVARYRVLPQPNRQIERFRAWLTAEAQSTVDWLMQVETR
jgi:LysR family glycine cleavage system transcriptional activator